MSAAGNPSVELSKLVRSWRERLKPQQIAGLVARGARRKHNVTQEDMARLIGYSHVWYGKLERGERGANYSADFLDRAAYALRLEPDERRMLYLLAVGHEPAPRGPGPSVGVNDTIRKLVDAQPWPAYISDDAWDVLAYNEHQRRWFPWVSYETNVMRWVFTYPEARDQLHRWETDWAPLMLAQMRVAAARLPDNARLGNLIEEILQVNAFARRLWDTEPIVYAHPDGDRRQVHLPYHDEVRTIEIMALEPLRAPNVRLMILYPCDT